VHSSPTRRSSDLTLQHAQKLCGAVEDILGRFGFDLAPVPNAHLCCGSAGTYSITEPELSNTLRRNKIEALESGAPELIATANIGCQTHLAGAANVPVRHWIELIDAHLPPQSAARSGALLGADSAGRLAGL